MTFTSSQEEFSTPKNQSFLKRICAFHGHPIERLLAVYERLYQFQKLLILAVIPLTLTHTGQTKIFNDKLLIIALLTKIYKKCFRW